MKIVQINALEPGMRLGEDITMRVGGKRKVMLARNHKLLSNEIEWLERRNIKTVKILEKTDIARDVIYQQDLERLSQQQQPVPKEMRILTEKEIGSQFSKITTLVRKKINLEEFRSKSFQDAQKQFNDKNFVKRVGDMIAELRVPVMNVINAILASNQTSVNLCSLKSIDNYTHEHCLNVAILCVSYGRLYQNKDQSSKTILTDLFNLAMAGILHDLGKTLIPRNILNKPGPLNAEEREVMNMHPTYGWHILEKQSMVSSYGKIAILQHHLNMDGSGYPQDTKYKQLTLLTKILSIADRYDAMTSDRPYRMSVSPPHAIEIIRDESIKGLLDYEIVKNFINLVGVYPVGTVVIGLSDEFKGVKGLVTSLSVMDTTKPIITFAPEPGQHIKVNTHNNPVKFRAIRALPKEDLQIDLPEQPEGEVFPDSLDIDIVD